MKKILLSSLVVLGVCFSGVGVAQTHSTVTPAIQDSPQFAKMWQQRNAAINERIAEGNVDLLFVGDSITHFWQDSMIWPRENGRAIWEEYYAPRHAVNTGIAADRTQHVLWRLENGNVDGISPKLAVVMIGTNNSFSNTAEEIADGIVAVVETLRRKLPETKVLLLAIFPRGEKPSEMRDKLAKASSLASRVADGDWVHYLDIGPKFLEADGTLSKEVMPDYLHPDETGYRIWAESIEPKVRELMDEGTAQATETPSH